MPRAARRGHEASGLRKPLRSHRPVLLLPGKRRLQWRCRGAVQFERHMQRIGFGGTHYEGRLAADGVQPQRTSPARGAMPAPPAGWHRLRTGR